MYRAIILDLDGTLFDSGRTVSELNRSVLRRCRESGILVIIATARPLRTVVRRLPGDIHDGYMVLCNGAWVVKGGAVVLRKELSPSLVQSVVGALQRLGYAPSIEANDCYYTDGERGPGFQDSYFSLGAYPGIAACKVLAFAKSGIDGRRVGKALGKEVSYVITDNDTLLQVAARGCSKLTACMGVLQAEGISLAETVAFGDDNNDIPVLEAVGCGIAMANGTPEIRKVAKHVTESNDDDGVARGILKYVVSGAVYQSLDKTRGF